MLASWAGFQLTMALSLGIGVLAFGTDSVREGLGAALVVGILALSIGGAILTHRLAVRYLEDAGPNVHLIATVVLGSTVILTILVPLALATRGAAP